MIYLPLVDWFKGDEFVVVIYHSDVDKQASHSKLTTIIQKLQDLICTSINFNGVKLNVSFSIGTYLFNDK